MHVAVTSEYAAGGIIQHMGYVISGTTQDGTYLVVRDRDTRRGRGPRLLPRRAERRGRPAAGESYRTSSPAPPRPPGC